MTLLPTQRPTSLAPAPFSSTPLPAPGDASTDLKVMTFNLRVATALDGLNTWTLRRGMVVDRIRDFGPDLLGTQEGLRGQTDFLREQLRGYDFFGAGRSDGGRRGEMCGIFYRSDRFEKIDGGHFWLSTRPQKPGSKAWGAWFPRMVTWVKLRPRDGASEPIVFVNTHLDAFSGRARLEGAKLLLKRMNEIAGGSPCILTGDFNADEGSPPYQKLTTALSAGKALLVDAFRAANPTEQRNEGTRHSFRGGRGGERIDWILASPCFQALSASIDHSRGVLGYPSDHFPVTATLRLVTAPSPTPMAQIE
jgi:endonuclease/exonuclease/phosphatase family metal-dependent hydrolase